MCLVFSQLSQSTQKSPSRNFIYPFCPQELIILFSDLSIAMQSREEENSNLIHQEQLFYTANQFTSMDGMQTFIGMQADQIAGYEKQLQAIERAVQTEKLSAEEKVNLVKKALRSDNERKPVSQFKQHDKDALLKSMKILEEKLRIAEEQLKIPSKTDEEYRKIEIKFKKADKKKKQAEQKVKQIEEQLRIAVQTLKIRDGQIRKNEDKYKKLDLLNKQLEKKVDNSEKEGKDASKKLGETLKLLEKCEKSLKTAEIKISSMEGDLRIKDKSVYEAEQLLLNARNQIRLLEKENGTLKTGKDNQKEVILAYKRGEQSMRTQFQKKEQILLKALKDKEVQLQQYIEKSKQPVQNKSELIQELAAMKEQIKVLSDEKARISDFNTQFRAQVNDMKQKVKISQEKLKQEEKSKQQLKQTYDKVREELQEYQQNYNSMPKAKLFELIGRFVSRLNNQQKLELKRQITIYIG